MIWITGLVFHVLFLSAAIEDFIKYRISNEWLLGMVFLGIFVSGTKFFFTVVVVLILLFPLFLFHMFGAGDIKLMAVMAGYYGHVEGIKCIILGFILGAFWSLFILWKQRSFASRLHYLSGWCRRVIQTKKITAYVDTQRDGYHFLIPFGTCLFAGSILRLIIKCLLR